MSVQVRRTQNYTVFQSYLKNPDYNIADAFAPWYDLETFGDLQILSVSHDFFLLCHWPYFVHSSSLLVTFSFKIKKRAKI